MDAKLGRLQVAEPQRFNPRARDGRERAGQYKENPPTGFNPRARDGREDIPIQYYINIDVSIHAPVMDANLHLV